MTREEYLNKRKELLDSADTLLNESKVEDAEKVMKEIEDLDAAYDKEAKQRAEAIKANGYMAV